MKYAIVTGGTKGIGKAIAISLLKEDYFVLLNYSNDDDIANKTYDELNSAFPSRLKLIKSDLSKPDSILSFCMQVKEITSSINVFVLNAGKTDRTQFGQVKYQSLLDVFNTNLFIPFFLIQELHTMMSKGDSIIMIGSLMGIHPHSLSISYGISKSGIHYLVNYLVKYLSPKGIRVNAIAPGFINTEWQTQKPESVISKLESKIALNRLGTPNEIAQTLLFLVNCDYVNGETITVSGGYSFE